MADLNVHLKRLGSRDTPISNHPGPDRVILSSCRLKHMEKRLLSLHDTITAIPITYEDISLIEQYDLQLSDHKSELAEIRNVLLSAGSEDEVQDQLSLHTWL